jgi:hypothetical protein
MLLLQRHSLFLLLCCFSQKQLHFRCDASGGASVLLAKPNLFIKCRKIFIFSVGWLRDEREEAQNSTSSGQIERTRRRRSSRWYDMQARRVTRCIPLCGWNLFRDRNHSIAVRRRTRLLAPLSTSCSPIQSQPRFAFKNLDNRVRCLEVKALVYSAD